MEFGPWRASNEHEREKRLQQFRDELAKYERLREAQRFAEKYGIPVAGHEWTASRTRHAWVLTDADKDFLRVQGIKPE